MTIRDLQRRAVDGIKRHALRIALDSPRAQARILTEYLWSEEGAETAALQETRAVPLPEWIEKLTSNQLADERRHVQLLRDRLLALGVSTDRKPPELAKAKFWWMSRATAPYRNMFAAGPIVVVMAVAAQFEGTAVRVFTRHLGVLEEHRPDDPTGDVLRSIVADEKRHAKSCATACERLVREDERDLLAELRETIASVDRAFGVSMSCAYWLMTAANAALDSVARPLDGTSYLPRTRTRPTSDATSTHLATHVTTRHAMGGAR